MTRINLVPPSELSRLHLLAEYRELPRVFGLVQKAIDRGMKPDDPSIPPDYTMGKGHVMFFYNKLAFLATRQQALINEMKARGMKPNFTASLGQGIPAEWWGIWKPDEIDLFINRQRISENNSRK